MSFCEQPLSVCRRAVWRWPDSIRAWALVLALSALAGCAVPPPAPPPPAATPLQQSVDRLTDVVLGQLGRLRPSAPGAAALPVAVGPTVFIDTGPDRRVLPVPAPVSRWVSERVAGQHRAHPLVAETDATARLRLRARLEAVDEPHIAAGPAPFMLTLEALDAVEGAVLVAASERVIDPVLQSLVPPRQAERPAPPPPLPENLQALNVEYVSLLKAGKETEAQAVFKRIVTEGLATRNLSVRLLFAPASSEFYPDPVLVRRYGSWLSEVADQLQRSTHCLEIVGHASRTGSDAANRRLSQQRASAVRQILLKQAPGLAPRLSTAALGRAQTLVGSGTDDLRDAVDRRVELRVVDCP